MRKLAMSVSVSIPPITAVPSMRRPAAPAPDAAHNGTQPKMNANEVIKSGRRRRRTPSSAASTRLRPCSKAMVETSTFRTADAVRTDERRERHHGAVVVPDVVIADVLYALAVFPFCLEVDAPLPAKAVELVQKETTEIGLQRLVDVRDGHALLQHFIAIHIGIDLRDGGGELCRDSRQLRTPAARGEELLQILVE